MYLRINILHIYVLGIFVLYITYFRIKYLCITYLRPSKHISCVNEEKEFNAVHFDTVLLSLSLGFCWRYLAVT